MVDTLGFSPAVGFPGKKEYSVFLYFFQWLMSVALLGGGGFAIGYFLFHPLPEWMRPSGKGSLYWSIFGNIFSGLFLITWSTVSLIRAYSKERLLGVTKGLISKPHIESFQREGHTVFRICSSVLYQVSGREYFGDYSGFGVTVGQGVRLIPPKIDRTLLKLTDGSKVTVHYDTAHPDRFSLEDPNVERRFGFSLGSAAAVVACGFFALTGAMFRLI
jgi:hypothetical protein